MSRKKILVAVAAAALLFGVGASGCNRNTGTRVASATVRGDRGTGQRPAEVLAASTRRPAASAAPRRQYVRENYYPSAVPTAVPPINSGQLARRAPAQGAYASVPAQYAVAAPNGMPAPRSTQAPQDYQMQAGPAFASSGSAPVYNRAALPPSPAGYAPAPQTAFAQAPAQTALAQSQGYISEPYILVPSQTNPGFYDKVYDRPVMSQAMQPAPYAAVTHPAPELVMARAQLQGSAPLSDRVILPAIDPQIQSAPQRSSSVPIPELQPIRYNGRALPARPRGAPVALAPIPAASGAAPSVQGWVASPATAMRMQ